MKCRYCTAEIPDSSSVCEYCGAALTDTVASQWGFDTSSGPINEYGNNNVQQNFGQTNGTQYGATYGQPSNTQTTTQHYYNQNGNSNIVEELVDAYIGKNVASIRGGGFSVPTFFLGIFYMLYRKMWLFAACWFAITLISCIFLGTYSGAIQLIVGIVASIKFNEWYVNHAREQVTKIREEHITRSTGELKAMCSKKGGTSIVAPLIYGLIIFVIVFGLAIAAFIFVMNGNNNISYHDTSSDTSVSSTFTKGNFGGKFTSVPKPNLDSTWIEEKGFEYSFDSIDLNHFDVYFRNKNSDVITPKFNEYKKILENNGFKYYGNNYESDVYIKGDTVVTMYEGYKYFHVKLESGSGSGADEYKLD